MNDLLASLFQFNEKFEQQDWFNLDDIKSKSSPIGEFLYNYFNDLYEFFSSNKVKLCYREDVDIAAITIINGLPVVYLNPHRITYIFMNFDIITAYNLIAGILYHEMLHYVFKHFRLPPQQFDTKELNYAQDIVIDNHIKTKIPQWRDWKEIIDIINNKIKENKIGLTYISLKPQKELIDEYKSIFELSDKDLYVYIKQTQIDVSQIKFPRFDTHSWNSEKSTSQNIEDKTQTQNNTSQQILSQETKDKQRASNENEQLQQTTKKTQNNTNQQISSQETKDKQHTSNENEQLQQTTKKQSLSKIAEDFYNDFISTMRKKYDKIQNDFFLSNSQDRTLEKQYKRIDETSRYNLFNILLRYVKKLSAKRKQQTWKKINKRYPYMYPGNIYKKNPGSVFLILDVSGSMHEFLEKHLVKIFSNIYYTFKKVSKLYGDVEKIYRANIDSKVRSFDEIKNIDELKEIKYHYGGGTNYSEIFTKYLSNWQKITKSVDKYPDLIIFVTDFDLGAMESIKSVKSNYQNLVKELDKRILWLYIESGEPNFNPGFGTIINVFSFLRLNDL